MSKCYYPSYENTNEFIISDHVWDKKGWCVICGEKRDRRMLSKKMLDWLQEQEEDDVDGYLDADLYIKEWTEEVKKLEEQIGKLTRELNTWR
jgi:hypothetical protein